MVPGAAPGRPLTLPVAVEAGSAVDPRAEEISWTAWYLRGARVAETDAALTSGISLFTRAAEALWLPGRFVAMTDLSWDPGPSVLTARFAVGILGPSGTTADEGRQIAAYVGSILGRAHVPFAAVTDDPAALLDAAGADAAHSVLIRQRCIEIDLADRGDGAGPAAATVLSRFSPVPNSAERVARALATRTSRTRFRATVMPTELGPDERGALDEQIRAIHHAQLGLAGRPELVLTLERAQATLRDVKASFASPLLVAEVALCSGSPLTETFCRAVGAAHTSELDVLRQHGSTTVAGQRLILGGFDVEPAPPGHAAALRRGLPFHGGTGPRSLRDVVTLTECPLGWTDDIRTFAWCEHAAWINAYADTFDALIESLIEDGVTLDAVALPQANRDLAAGADEHTMQRKRAALRKDLEQLQDKVEELEDRLEGRRAKGKDISAIAQELADERTNLQDKQSELDALIVQDAVPAQRREVDVDQLDPFAAFIAAVRASANSAASATVLTTGNLLTPPGRATLSDDRTALTFTTVARLPHEEGFVERPFTFTVPNAYGASWRASGVHRGNGPGDGLLSTAERLEIGLSAVLRDGQDIESASATAHMQRNWTLSRLQRLWDPNMEISRGLRAVLFRAPVSTRQAVWHGHNDTAAPAHLDPRYVRAQAVVYRSRKSWSVKSWVEGQLLDERAAALAIALSLPDPSAGVPAKALTRMLAAGRFTANNISIRRRGQVTGLPSMQRVLRQEDGTLKTDGADLWRGGQLAELYGAQRVRPIACPWTDCRSQWATLLLAAPDTVLMGTGLGPRGTDLDHGTLVICRECHRGPKNPARYPEDVVAQALDPLAAAPGSWRACAWRSCRRDDGHGPGKVWVFDGAPAGGPYFHDDLCRRHEHLPPDYVSVECAAPGCTETFSRAQRRRGILKVFHNADCRTRTEAARQAAEKVKVVVINCRYAGCTIDAGHGPGKVAQVYDGGSGGRSTYHGPECRKAEQRRRRGLLPLESAWTKCGYDQCSQVEEGGQPGHFPVGDGRRAFHDNNCRRKAVTAQRRGASNGFVTCGWAHCEQDDGNGVGSLRLPDDGSSRNRRFHPQCQAARRRSR